MMNPLMGESEATLGEEVFHLVMNNAAWAAVERVLDDSYIDILADIVRREFDGKSPKNSVVGALLWGAFRAHHGEYTLAQCGDMMMEHPEAFNEPLGLAIRASIKLKDPVPGEATPPTQAAEQNGTGTKPSKPTKKRADGR